MNVYVVAVVVFAIIGILVQLWSAYLESTPCRFVKISCVVSLFLVLLIVGVDRHIHQNSVYLCALMVLEINIITSGLVRVCFIKNIRNRECRRE